VNEAEGQARLGAAEAEAPIEAPPSGPRLEPLVTAEETRRAEDAHDGSLEELMERAGTAVARVVLARFPGRVAVVCGKGNNGGDGRVCARVIREAGREVTVVEGLGDLGEPDVIVDALLGIGLKEAPREDAARMIERINASGKPVVAIDVPSGVDASTGEVPGVAVRATVTVTFAAAKVGLAIAPGRAHAGSVHVASIGLATHEHEHALVPATALAAIPRKSRGSTKYRAGSVLVVGGSRGMTGAPMLAALAAFRADAGYVGIATPESSVPVIESRVLEAVKWPLPEDSAGRLLARSAEGVLEAADRADAVALGPGLGRTDGTKQLVRVLLERLELPVVVDADALWELEPFARAAPTVLTPHSGELARLLAATAEEVDAHRLHAVRRATSIYGSVVLLKGADTLVGAPRAGLLVAGYGLPSLATAGTGDVLAGVIAAFLAKGLEPQLAAAAGAVAHGLASRLAEPQVGMVASDLLPALPRALGGDGWQWPPLS
jgi:NAD(P)H-hydrate epimerase